MVGTRPAAPVAAAATWGRPEVGRFPNRPYRGSKAAGKLIAAVAMVWEEQANVLSLVVMHDLPISDAAQTTTRHASDSCRSALWIRTNRMQQRSVCLCARPPRCFPVHGRPAPRRMRICCGWCNLFGNVPTWFDLDVMNGNSSRTCFLHRLKSQMLFGRSRCKTLAQKSNCLEGLCDLTMPRQSEGIESSPEPQPMVAGTEPHPVLELLQSRRYCAVQARPRPAHCWDRSRSPAPATRCLFERRPAVARRSRHNREPRTHRAQSPPGCFRFILMSRQQGRSPNVRLRTRTGRSLLRSTRY